jgi:HEAT repeat protein
MFIKVCHFGWVFLVLLSLFPSGRYGILAAREKKGQISVESFIEDLKSPDPALRREAAKVLGDNRITSAVPKLMEAAGDPEKDVRKEVLVALDKIRDPQAIPTYINLLNDPVKDIRKRSLAALINSYIIKETGLVAGTKRVIDVVNPFSSADDDLIIEPYTEVDPAVITAVKGWLPLLDSDLREAAAKALGILRGRAALPDMVTALKRENDGAVKVALIKSFYKIGDPSVGPELLPLIRDPNKSVHDEAISTIGLLRTREAVPELTRIYESGVEERKKILKIIPASGLEDLQLKALRALSLIADPGSKDLFAKALRHPSSGFRQAGAEGLARIPDPALATEVNRERLREKDGGVKLAESFVLYRMGRKEHLDDLVNSLTKMTLRNQAEAYLLEFSKKEQEELYPYLGSSSAKVRERLCSVLGQIGDPSTLPQVEPLARDKNSDVAEAANQAVRRIQGKMSISRKSTSP